VKLFAFTHVSNSLGTINPAAELCRQARAAGALTLIDAAQRGSFAMMQEVMRLPRFLRTQNVLRPGTRALWPREVRNGAALARQRRDDRQCCFGEGTYKSAARSEAGTPNIAGAIGLAAAISYLRDWPPSFSRTIRRWQLMPLNGSPNCLVCVLGPQRAWRPRQFVMEVSIARPHHFRRSTGLGLARRAPLQSALDAQRLVRHDARELLFLQHGGGNHRMMEILPQRFVFFMNSNSKNSIRK
jgi:hypothetical protein